MFPADFCSIECRICWRMRLEAVSYFLLHLKFLIPSFNICPAAYLRNCKYAFCFFENLITMPKLLLICIMSLAIHHQFFLQIPKCV